MKSVAPRSRSSRYAAEPVPAPAPLRDCASAFARCRCSAISRRNPSSSTARPCSPAISRVRSIGNPYVSCSWNARCPDSVAPPACLVSRTAVSRIAVPARSVWAKASSSAYA